MREEIYKILTPDLYELVLTRIKPKRAGAWYSLLLIPGLGQNRFTWVKPGSDFAEWFAGEGVDVWILEQRGIGRSSRKGEPYTWSIDEIIKYDVPSSIDFILKESGRQKVFIAGHSLGGCIIYCVLSLREKKIAGFISLGAPYKYDLFSPAWFIKLGAVFNLLPTRLNWKPPLEKIPYFPLPLLGGAAVIGMPILNTPVENVVPLHPWHRKNVRKIRLIRRILSGFEKVSPKVVSQFLKWMGEGRFTSYDGKSDYTDSFIKATVPGLFIAGDKDRLAPPSSVKYGYDIYSFKKKKFILLNEKEHLVHWGHLDLTMGKHCQKVLYPILLNWMANVIREG